MSESTRPTQSRYPWRAVARTAVALLPLVLAMIPDVVDTVGLSQTKVGAGAVLVSLTITRVFALPTVNAVLQASGILSWLAAEPKREG